MQEASSALDFILLRKAYLLKINEKEKDLASGYFYGCLKGALGGQLEVVVKSKKKVLNGLKPTTTLFKAETYIRAKLRPRAIDTDFANGELPDIALEDADASVGIAAEQTL